jgi:arylformamidase
LGKNILLRLIQILAFCFSLAVTASSATAGKLYEGVSIGGGLKVNIYAPENARRGLFSFARKKAPVIVYVHGGGWVRGTRAKVYRLPQFANQRGYMVVSVDYRPVPQTTIDGQLNDVTRGIRWVQRNIKRYGGDPKRVVIMGHSAGSHLVAMVAAKGTVRGLRGVIPNDVQAYDMIAYGGMRGNLPRVYAMAFGTTPKNWARWSPVTYLRSRNVKLPPFLIMHSGGNITARRRMLSRGFAAELRRRGARVTMFDGRRYTHGAIMSRIGKSAEVTNAVSRFLRRVF